jgi:hypothetical protein
LKNGAARSALTSLERKRVGEDVEPHVFRWKVDIIITVFATPEREAE